MKRILCLVLTFIIFLSSLTPVFAAMSYSYDANGNMTSDGTNCYVYNEANELKQVKNCTTNALIEEYLYDSNGTRIIKKVYVNGTLNQTIYSPTDNYETKKLSDNSTQNTSYYYANDQLVAKKNPDASINYFQDDQLGSTSLVTNQTGAVVENSSYYPYGETRTGGTASKYLYTGQEKDTTGLYYYGARFYNPHIAHFTQPDTLIQNAYDPQSLNRYAYTRDNPVKYIDTDGHQFIPLLATVTGNVGDMIDAFTAGSVYGGALGGFITCFRMSSCRTSPSGMMETTLVGAYQGVHSPFVQAINSIGSVTDAVNIPASAINIVTGAAILNPAVPELVKNIVKENTELVLDKYDFFAPYDVMKDQNFYYNQNQIYQGRAQFSQQMVSKNPFQTTSTPSQANSPTGAAKSFIQFTNALQKSLPSSSQQKSAPATVIKLPFTL